ncbi:MAG TPA: hypothetical protein VGK99_08110 [Acidobacteriota bacterium]|jgi:hypothetical protein
MGEATLILIGCLWLFLTGLGMAQWCIPAGRFTEKAALAFPVSAGLHAAVFFLLAQGWQASVWWSLLPFAPFLLSLGKLKIARAAGWKFLELAVLVLVVFTAFQIFVHVFFVPAVEWDCIALWFMKGKALAVDGRITASFASWLEAQGLHGDYPWNVPLMYAWLSRIAGRFSELGCKAVAYCFYVSLVLILYCLARLRFQRPAALLALSVYLAIPATVAHVFYRDADTILETYLAALIFLVLRYQFEPSAKTAALLAGLTFLTSWTKREGLVYCAMVLVPWVAWLAWKKGSRGWLFPAAAAGSVLGIAAFWIPKKIFGATTMFAPGLREFQGIAAEFHQFGSILYLMSRECLKIYHWNFAWLLVPLLLLARRDRYGLKILFMAHLLVYFLVYYLSPVDFRWHITTSWSRLLLHALPELYAWAVFVAGEYLGAELGLERVRASGRIQAHSPITFTRTRFFLRPSNSP